MAPTAYSYDLFLSYNSEDHGVVEDIARKLRDEGLEPFLDRLKTLDDPGKILLHGCL
jgi:hypothetical protein